MGFSGLRHFGPPLVHHMQLKIRKETSVSNFMLVDSPGMIDSPITQDSDFNKSGGFDRGYGEYIYLLCSFMKYIPFFRII